jgi:hypothetical protein
MDNLVTGAFARILETNRSRFNAKFAEARHIYPTLQPEVFAEHLCATVAPIVRQVEEHCPDRTAEVVVVLYELSLDLVGQAFLGGQSRHAAIATGWKELLPMLPQHVAAEPGRCVGAITNALYNLSVTGGARPQQWMEHVRRLAPLCPDVSSLLRAASVAAWVSGLAHFRQQALDICRGLGPPVVCAALGLPVDGDAVAVQAMVERLFADPWLNPASSLKNPGPTRRLGVVARVGAFRGFGGPFVAPPVVVGTAEGSFVIKDGDSFWLLTADRFGGTWQRTDGGPLPQKLLCPVRTSRLMRTDGCRGIRIAKHSRKWRGSPARQTPTLRWQLPPRYLMRSP